MRTTLETRVLNWLQEKGSITQKEAIDEFGAYRLSAIIYNLRQEGYEINTVTENGKNRWGDPVSWGRYYYVYSREEK